MIVSKEERTEIIKILNNPNKLSNIFEIKNNIKTYVKIEKLDTYVSIKLDDLLNSQLDALADELSKIDDLKDRNEVIYEFTKNIKEFKNKSLAFGVIVSLIHRMNKKLNLYMLD